MSRVEVKGMVVFAMMPLLESASRAQTSRSPIRTWYDFVSRARQPPSPGIPPDCGPLAQLAEQQTLNLRVDGSIPSRLTTFSSALSDGAK